MTAPNCPTCGKPPCIPYYCTAINSLRCDRCHGHAAAMLGVEIVTAEDAKRIVREQEEAERG